MDEFAVYGIETAVPSDEWRNLHTRNDFSINLQTNLIVFAI